MMSYICPSMTPTSGNPAFRVYTVDATTLGVLDMTTYITNLSLYETGTTSPVWEKYYSAKSTYGALIDVTGAGAEMTPAFWHNVTGVFESSTADFDAYYARKSRGWNVQSCTSSCVTDEICRLRAGEAQYNCFSPTPGINFRKRDETAAQEKAAHFDECEGSGTRSVMMQIVGRNATSSSK